ncbi:hypothetical protein KP509_21G032200 [Ceratopteris richardii]|uniref:Dirigent protein n=1 Tax=Ceratopteris richardii TaxID=49495 RepID=A0A8T2S8S4_CERRI|nr:hypothetical protein KP509_21G032200 [Ceratopteris richardii]
MLPTVYRAAAAALVALLIAAYAPAKAALPGQRVENMVFYMHDLPNVTAAFVAPPQGNSGPSLGTALMFDDKLTRGPRPGSTEVGRGQGMYSVASLGSGLPALLFVFTAVLHKPVAYDGSTICLQGSDRTFLAEREIAVVGGTGRFRFARGYAILSTVNFNLSNGDATIKFNLTMALPHHANQY